MRICLSFEGALKCPLVFQQLYYYQLGITNITRWTGHGLLSQETATCCDYITSTGPDSTNLAKFTSSKSKHKKQVINWKIKDMKKGRYSLNGRDRRSKKRGRQFRQIDGRPSGQCFGKCWYWLNIALKEFAISKIICRTEGNQYKRQVAFMMVGPQGGRYIGNKGGLVMLQCPEYSAIVPITWIAIELQANIISTNNSHF